MIQKPAAVGLLTYVVGIALLLARAAARDRLPFTATIAVVLTLLMPAVYVAGIRSIRSGMSFRRELFRSRSVPATEPDLLPPLLLAAASSSARGMRFFDVMTGACPW